MPRIDTSTRPRRDSWCGSRKFFFQPPRLAEKNLGAVSCCHRPFSFALLNVRRRPLFPLRDAFLIATAIQTAARLSREGTRRKWKRRNEWETRRIFAQCEQRGGKKKKNQLTDWRRFLRAERSISFTQPIQFITFLLQLSFSLLFLDIKNICIRKAGPERRISFFLPSGEEIRRLF